MADPTVCPCSRPVTDGYLCHTCTDTMRKHLHGIADLSRGLGEKRAQYRAIAYTFGRATSAGNPLPYDTRVSPVEAECLHTLRAAASIVWERRTPRPAVSVTGKNVGAVAVWLSTHARWIRGQPEAPDVAASITRAHASLARLFDNPAPSLYLGTCGVAFAGVHCTLPLYVESEQAPGGKVVAGSAHVTCGCGAVHDVTERREWVADALGNYQATMRELVCLAPILVPEGVSHSRLKRLSAQRAFQPAGRRKTVNTAGAWRDVDTYRIADVQHAVNRQRNPL